LYFNLNESFNVLFLMFLIARCDQKAAPPVATSPIAKDSVVFSPSIDYAYGSMDLWDGLNGTAVHSRAVTYVRADKSQNSSEGDFVCVVDRLQSSKARKVQATWHTHPNSSVTISAVEHGFATIGGVIAKTGKLSLAQLCLVPAAKGAFSSSWTSSHVIRGQRQEPSKGVRWQGWYSQSYDDAWEASVLVYEATNIPSGAVFAWLLVPSAQPVDCSLHQVKVLSSGDNDILLSVQMHGFLPRNVTVRI
jgi:hypothetical protein